MNWLLNIFIILLCVVFQTTIMPELSIKISMANILLVVFIIILFFRFYDLSLVWASIGGLFLDFTSTTPSGAFFLGFLIIYIILFIFFRIFEFKEFIALILIIFLSSILFDLLMILYLNIWGYGLSFTIFYTTIISSGILNVILALILYPILAHFNRYTSTTKEKTISLSGFYK